MDPGPIIISEKVGQPLRALAGMSVEDFTRTYGQLFLDVEPQARRSQAVVWLQKCAGHPLVLVGRRVRDAFNMPNYRTLGDDSIQLVGTCWLIVLPLTSALHLAEARRRLWLAVDLWRHPIGPYRRDFCSQCLRLTEVHPPHPNDKSLRVMCPGETMRFCYPLTRSC